MARPGYRINSRGAFGGGTFVPNPLGYREVLNGRVTLAEMQSRGEMIAASATGQSGIDYVVDSQQGLNRIHTRVTTPADVSYFMRERSYMALAVVAGQGSTGGYTTLARAMKRSGSKPDRGWKAIAGNTLKWTVNSRKR